MASIDSDSRERLSDLEIMMVEGSATVEAHVERYGSWMPSSAARAVAREHGYAGSRLALLHDEGAVVEDDQWHTASLFAALGY